MSILKVESIREPYNNTEAMFIDSSGDVTFSGSVVIPGTISGVDLTTLNTTVSTLATDLTSLNSTVGNIVGLPEAIDVNASAPADSLSIDSSGNLLVGTTDSNVANNSGSGNDGVNIHPDSVRIARTDYDLLLLNRLNSDGDIVKFLKDGTTVGSIGANSGQVYIAGTAQGIKCGSGNVRPTNGSGSTTDDLVTLGSATFRFKDIYLSGGVYLGGTGSANKLDDYEEGTWSPTPRGSSSDPSGYTSSIIGTYTKIGNKVWCNVNMTLNNDGSNGSGYFYINGFPFTPDSSQIFVVEGHNCERLMTDMRTAVIKPLLTSNRVLFYYGSDNTAGMSTLQWGTHVNTNLRFRVTFSYTI